MSEGGGREGEGRLCTEEEEEAGMLERAGLDWELGRPLDPRRDRRVRE